MSRQPDTQSEGVSKVWSCTTLGEGLVHVKDGAGMTSGEDEAALLAQLQEQSKFALFQVLCSPCYPCSLLQPLFLMMENIQAFYNILIFISKIPIDNCLGPHLQEIDEQLGTKACESPKAIAPVC